MYCGYILIFLFILVLPQPVFSDSPEDYTPDKNIHIEKYESDIPVKRDIPLDGHFLPARGPSATAAFDEFVPESQYMQSIPKVSRLSSRLRVIRSVIDIQIESLTKILIHSLTTTSIHLWLHIKTLFVQILNLTVTDIQNDIRFPELNGSVSGATTRYSPPSQIIRNVNGVLLPPLLSIPQTSQSTSYMSRFAVNPYHPDIPKEITEVYTWDPIWNPQYNPYNYIQCTTYVAMVYNINGISLKGKLKGNANEWIQLTDTFEVYESGKTTEFPAVLDTVVWADRGMNHVGIITHVQAKGNDWLIQVANGNSTQELYTYIVVQKEDGTYVITSPDGDTSTNAWVPSHWLRVKKYL